MDNRIAFNEKIAKVIRKRARRYCFSCGIMLAKGEDRCPDCGTDDLGIFDPETCSGPSWFVEDLFKSFLREEMADFEAEWANDDDAFEEYLNDIWGTVMTPWGVEYDAGRMYREMDPVAFDAKWADETGSDDRLVELCGVYYDAERLDEALDEALDEMLDE